MDCYVVLIHRGSGEVGGVFASQREAMDYVGENPPCDWSIVYQRLGAPPSSSLKAYVNRTWQEEYLKAPRVAGRVMGDFPPVPAGR